MKTPHTKHYSVWQKVDVKVLQSSQKQTFLHLAKVQAWLLCKCSNAKPRWKKRQKLASLSGAEIQ